MTTQPTQCPYCKSLVLVNIKWAETNGRVFCNTCCKAFDILVGEEEAPPPIPESIKQESPINLDATIPEDDESEDDLTTADIEDYYDWF